MSRPTLLGMARGTGFCGVRLSGRYGSSRFSVTTRRHWSSFCKLMLDVLGVDEVPPTLNRSYVHAPLGFRRPIATTDPIFNPRASSVLGAGVDNCRWRSGKSDAGG